MDDQLRSRKIKYTIIGALAGSIPGLVWDYYLNAFSGWGALGPLYTTSHPIQASLVIVVPAAILAFITSKISQTSNETKRQRRLTITILIFDFAVIALYVLPVAVPIIDYELTHRW